MITWPHGDVENSHYRPIVPYVDNLVLPSVPIESGLIQVCKVSLQGRQDKIQHRRHWVHERRVERDFTLDKW